jgi:hypothetical protein
MSTNRLGREQENKTCHKTRDSRLPSKFQTFWEEIHERKSEQYPGRNGSERCPPSRSQLPTEQGQKARPGETDSGQYSQENRAQQFVLSRATRLSSASPSSGAPFDLGLTLRHLIGSHATPPN